MGGKVAFTVRKKYFELIVAGSKSNEIRRATPHWRKVAARQPNLAVFLCGRLKPHWREVLQVTVEEDEGAAERILGRPLSSQGLQDVGSGPVVVFWLGEHATDPRTGMFT